MQVAHTGLIWLLKIDFVERLLISVLARFCYTSFGEGYVARLVAREKVGGHLRMLLVDGLDHTTSGYDRLLAEEHYFHCLNVCDSIKSKGYREAEEEWLDFVHETPHVHAHHDLLFDAWGESPHHYRFYEDWC